MPQVANRGDGAARVSAKRSADGPTPDDSELTSLLRAARWTAGDGGAGGSAGGAGRHGGVAAAAAAAAGQRVGSRQLSFLICAGCVRSWAPPTAR